METAVTTVVRNKAVERNVTWAPVCIGLWWEVPRERLWTHCSVKMLSSFCRSEPGVLLAAVDAER